MGKFSIRLDNSTEKLLSGIMKQERFKTKNACIEEIIKEHSRLKKALQDKIRELNTLSDEHDRLYYLVKQVVDSDRKILEFFNKPKKRIPKSVGNAFGIRRLLDEEE